MTGERCPMPLLALAASLVGCGGQATSVPIDLARDRPALVLSVSAPGPSGHATLTLDFGAGGATSACPTMPAGMAARWDGLTMSRLSAGGVQRPLLDNFNPSCLAGAFSLEQALSTTASTTITLSQDQTLWTMVVANPVANRTLAIGSPGADALKVGQPVTLQWSPGTDTVRAVDLTLTGADGRAVSIERASADAGVLGSSVVTESLPPVPAGAGTMTAVVYAAMGVTSCDGPAQCTALPDPEQQTVTLPVHVVP